MKSKESSRILKQEKSLQKCKDIAEWIKAHHIDGEFKLEEGVICLDYTKATNGFITTMLSLPITSTYCYVAYKNLQNIKAIAQEIGYKKVE